MYRITVSPRGVEADFEVGSIAEAIGILQNEHTEFASLVAIAIGGTAAAIDGKSTTGAKRGRPAKNQPDATTAVAPAPAPLPDAPPPIPDPAPAIPDPALMKQVQDSAVNGLEMPEFLKRTADAPPPPPPLPAPAAPPVAPPAATPAFILGGKVADVIAKKTAESVDKGAALLAWLMAPNCAGGFIAPGTTPTIDEVIAVLRFTDDDKVKPIAGALQVA